jgi:protoporphyrinogen oxidase
MSVQPEEAIEDNRPRTTGRGPKLRREGVKSQIAEISKRLREHDITLEDIKRKEQSEESSNTEMLDNLQIGFENLINDMRAEFDKKLAASNAEIDKLKKQIIIMRGEAKIQGQQVKVTSKHLGDLADTVDEIVRDINGDVDDTYA